MLRIHFMHDHRSYKINYRNYFAFTFTILKLVPIVTVVACKPNNNVLIVTTMVIKRPTVTSLFNEEFISLFCYSRDILKVTLSRILACLYFSNLFFHGKAPN